VRHFTMARQQQHDDVVVVMGGGGKGQLTRRGAPFKGHMRWWLRAALMVGGNGGRERWVGAVAETASEALGGQGSDGHDLNAVSTAAPLFRPCG
jgi:hypothetical protein